MILDLPHESALAPLAARLVAALPERAFLAVSGDLGAGKTTFAKALAAACGIDPDAVTSPTFGLIHLHTSAHCRLIHADMYRLQDPGDLGEIGWEDCLTLVHPARQIAFVEWPERIASALPAERLDVTITTTGPSSRQFSLVGHGPEHEAALAVLASES